MKLFICLISVAAAIGLLLFITLLICFVKPFYSKKRIAPKEDEYPLPEGDIYEQRRDEMVGWIKNYRSLKSQDLTILSHDGLTLRAKYFEYQKGAITEILFHGYRGSGERDLGGGIERCFALGRNCIVVDHRASGQSDGNVISFGINECKDCLRWVDFAIDYLGKDTKLVLTGISMGAATVMMAAGEELPSNVVCILADCGYSSAREIIIKVINEMKLPGTLLYPFVRSGAKLFGGFDPDSNSPEKAVSAAKVPMIFIHGDSDDFVPCEMSKKVFKKCSSQRKKLVIIENAGHGLAYPVDKEKYLSALRDFQKECGF